MSTFIAIDFETADYRPDSACAVGLVRVENWQVSARVSRLIRPPRSWIRFTHIHGIRWDDVKDHPPFAVVWQECLELLAGAEFFVAHNAGFDRGVLSACCTAACLPPPALTFVCSMLEARRRWGIRPTRLPHVCQCLGIDLRHHDALSDAEAAARIMIAARSPALELPPPLPPEPMPMPTQ